jgi:hypothetical protein
MLGIGILALWVGYQNLVYGWDQLNHGNAGYFQLAWPGNAKNIAPDDGGSNKSPGTSSTPNLSPTNNDPSGFLRTLIP